MKDFSVDRSITMFENPFSYAEQIWGSGKAPIFWVNFERFVWEYLKIWYLLRIICKFKYLILNKMIKFICVYHEILIEKANFNAHLAETMILLKNLSNFLEREKNFKSLLVCGRKSNKSEKNWITDISSVGGGGGRRNVPPEIGKIVVENWCYLPGGIYFRKGGRNPTNSL